MKRPVKIPRTFILFAKTSDDRDGYVRFKSHSDANLDIQYHLTLTRRISDASRYVSLDNLKKRAKSMKVKFHFKSLEIIDETTKKRHIIA